LRAEGVTRVQCYNYYFWRFGHIQFYDFFGVKLVVTLCVKITKSFWNHWPKKCCEKRPKYYGRILEKVCT
jgi:hypothetical protein